MTLQAEPTNDTGPYAQTADTYHKAGWHPFPVVGKAGHVPEGVTGKQGTNPGRADVYDWIIDRGDDNIAVRLDGLIGIDIDAYTKDGVTKQGDTTLALAETKWGPLPPTWTSTARGAASPARIRFYRVPAGYIHLATLIRLPHPDTGELHADIEIIQYHHRYAVVWPSIHPDTRTTYRWYRPNGSTANYPPNTNTLPELPQTWLEALTAEPQTNPDRDPINVDPQHADRSHWHPLVTAAHTRAMQELQGGAGSRHDATLANVGRLARHEEQGRPGATTALEELRSAFIVTVDRSGRDTAATEYDRMVASSRHQAATTTSLDDLVTEVFADLPTIQPPTNTATPTTVDPPDEPAGGPIDIAHWWDNPTPPKQADTLTRTDGISLLYGDELNWIHGDSGSGKTWVLLLAVLQLAQAGRNVLWVHYEDPTPNTILNRLRTLGATRQTILDHFHYWDPAGEPLNTPAILQHSLEHDITFVALDSVGEALNAQSLDEDKDPQVGPWLTHGPRALVNHGIGFCGVDHGTKAGERPLHPSGSKRKRAAVTGAGLLVESIVAPTQTTAGELRITCAKDRQGNHPQGAEIGVVHMTPNLATGVLDMRIVAPTEPLSATLIDPEAAQRSKLERQALEALRAAEGPVTLTTLRASMSEARNAAKIAAVEKLVELGEVVEVDGPQSGPNRSRYFQITTGTHDEQF